MTTPPARARPGYRGRATAGGRAAPQPAARRRARRGRRAGRRAVDAAGAEGRQRVRPAAHERGRDPPAGGREAPRSGPDRRGHLRRDEVRPAHSAAGARRPDADHARRPPSSWPTARAPPRSRRGPGDAGGQHRLRQLLPALPARRVPRQRHATRWPPTTAASRTSTAGSPHARAAGARVDRRRDPVPGDPGVRRRGCCRPSATTATSTPPSCTAEPCAGPSDPATVA